MLTFTPTFINGCNTFINKRCKTLQDSNYTKGIVVCDMQLKVYDIYHTHMVRYIHNAFRLLWDSVSKLWWKLSL